MKRLGIRCKLTLWYGGVLVVVLLVFSAAVFLTMRHHLLLPIDQGLAEEAADVLYEVKRADHPEGLHTMLVRRFAQHQGFDFQVTTSDGKRFFASPRLQEMSLSLPEPSLHAAQESLAYESVAIGPSGGWRVVSIRTVGPDGPLTVQVARSLAFYDQELQELLSTFLLTGPLTLLAAVGGGYFLARRALAPVYRMTQTANQVTADRLNQRIPVDNADDELGALAQTLNRMIERLERSFTEMQRFTADAAHELRTPLAVIRNEAEVALRSPRSAEEYCHVLENLLEETIRLTAMADQLLFLCRQDAGLHPTGRAMVATDDLLREVVGNMQAVAEEKGVFLWLDENPRCQVLGDRGQLRQVFYNLLDNAIKYTGHLGRVTVSGNVADGRLCVAVADTGVGIPPEHLPHVFDRFYRVDPSRTGDGQGAGLGLSICRSIVNALGGAITLENAPEQGTKVVVTLSLAQSAAQLPSER